MGLLVALLLAGFGSHYASSAPDGLAKVATDLGFNNPPDNRPDKSGQGGQEHASGASPLAGYSLREVDDERLSGGLAGVAGVTLTFLLGGALVLLVRRRGAGSGPDARDAGQSTGRDGAPS